MSVLGECFTERDNLEKLVSMSEVKGVASLRGHNRSEVGSALNQSKRISKLNPVVLQLDSNINSFSEHPLNLSVQSTEKPEPEKSDSMYQRLIHLNMKEGNAEEIVEDNMAHKQEELQYSDTEKNPIAMHSSETKNAENSEEIREERVSSLKKLLNQKYGESKLQSYTFTSDNEVKSVAALSIMPSKSFNLSEYSLTNIHSDCRNVNTEFVPGDAQRVQAVQLVKESNKAGFRCNMKKSFSTTQNPHGSESGSIAEELEEPAKQSSNTVEDITNKVVNTSSPSINNKEPINILKPKRSHKNSMKDKCETIMTDRIKDNSNTKEKMREVDKTRNEVKSLHNFLKNNYSKSETLPYNIKRSSNDFYNKIMEDSNVNHTTDAGTSRIKDNLNDHVQNIATKEDKSLQEKLDEIEKELQSKEAKIKQKKSPNIKYCGCNSVGCIQC
eukprot:TRINITY_DN9198_c0_g1_i4.p1 TRINITY_DN9198_c0_g1~~TRINITY_DN9198_c0_g1_i4.p1  ORF type:complete len:442 (-),score=80.27 TRINITY_DN9198_c0_g1_i4:402-1727(-)